MKHLFTTTAMLFSMTAFAQVGINNTSPKATLDITAKTTDGSKPEGLIIPQLSGNNIRTATTAGVYGTNQKGLIVYASSADTAPTGATANITTAGYYYFDGTNWQKISTGNTVSTSLASGNIYVGNASNVATAVTPTGDVTIDNAGVTSIGAGKVTNTQIATGAGGIYKGSGSLSGNTTVTQGANTLTFNSTATNGFSVDGTTLSVDAANDRIGVGTIAPQARLHISGAGGFGGDHFRMTNSASDWALASENAGAQNGITGKASFTIVDRANTVRRMTIGADNSFRLGGDISTGTAALSIDGPTNKVGIGTNTPQATLDIKAGSNGSSPEGIIVPRLTADQIQLGTYGSNQIGTLIYALAAATSPNTVTAEITEPGFYYFNGTKWKKINSSGSTISYTTIADPNILGYVPSTTATASVDAPATLAVGSATATRQGTGTFGGHTYASYSTSAAVTWYQAYNAAKNMGGYLAVFTSDAEWQYVETNLLTPFTIFNTNGGHIGMARFSWGAGPGLVPDPEMKWITGEQPNHDYSAGGISAVRKSNWFYASQPDGGTEGFVAFVGKNAGNTKVYNGYTSTHPWHDVTANSSSIGLTGGFIVEFQQ